MSFILGILIIGALLSFIFGKQIGALFCTGVFTVAIIFMGLAAACFLGILIWGGYFSSGSSKTASSSDYNSTYGTQYGTTSGTSTGYQATSNYQATPSYQASTGASQPQTAQGGASTGQDVQSTSYVQDSSRATIGAQLDALNENARRILNVGIGYGEMITNVQKGSPAEQAGLQPGDVVLEMDGIADTSHYTFAQYETQKGASRTIELSAYRYVNGTPYHWHPIVTPQ